MIKPFQPEKQSLKILVYGRSGTGKTYSLSTIPDAYRPVIIANVDNKLVSLPSDKTKDFYVSEHIKSVQEYGEFLKSASEMEFKTLIIDSLSLLQQRHGQSMSSLVEDPQKRLIYYDRLYRHTIQLIDKTIETFPDKTIICTLLEDIDGLTGRYSGELMLTGKSKSVLPSRFDIIMYAKKQKGKYMWVINSDENLTKIVPSMSDLPNEIEQDYSLVLR
ncbi:MAG: ATP-binding protein [Candidatus Calescibacterium sp.]|nr:ATP-binding protein [Candidatus Calescibacterium sp.]